MTDADNREVSQTVFRALLDAAGPSGTIQISIRIFPEHVEVDVLHSAGGPGEPTLAALGAPPTMTQSPTAQYDGQGDGQGDGHAPDGHIGDGQSASFAEWMTEVLRREGLTQEAAARQLGVSVKTVSRWVGGETEPRLRDLRRIQERFGHSPLP